MNTPTTRDIKFSKETHFIGRNGQFRQAGVALTRTAENSVMIEPITSKGHYGRALLEIPIDSLPEVVTFLLQSQGGVV